MAPKVLFSKVDIFNVIESQKQRLKDAYLRLPEDQAIDEEVIRRLKSEYMLDVPVLRTGEMYCVELKTQVDVSRMPNRIVFGSGPVMEEATELTVHIPFDGDPGAFNIAPSAYNSRVAEGEVIGSEVLLRFVVVDSIYDTQSQIDREVAQINWALTHLREKKEYENQELESTLRQAVGARKRSIESRGNVIANLKIPVRQSSGASSKPANSQAVGQQPEREASASPPSVDNAPQWEVFISHASEDKGYVEPLVKSLNAAGISVWYDRMVLEWGDELRKRIDHGLANCRYGIVVFSKAFLAGKKWTDHEFNGLFALEKHGTKLILPIWHGITQDELLSYSPAFASRLAKDSSTDSYEDIQDSLLRMLKRPIPDGAKRQDAVEHGTSLPNPAQASDGTSIAPPTAEDVLGDATSSNASGTEVGRQRDPGEFEQKAKTLLLAGYIPPAEWLPFVHKLDFRENDFARLELLQGLGPLQELYLDSDH